MKKYLLIVVVLLWYQFVFCQNVPGVQTPCTTASQGNASQYMIISYTIGEMPLVQSWKNNGLLITQGIMQPLTFIADTAYECFSQTEVKIYPNPNPGTFSLQLSLFKKGAVKTLLFDATGKMIRTDQFNYSTFITKQFDINQMASGTYYLQLLFTETGTNKTQKCAYTIQKINQ